MQCVFIGGPLDGELREVHPPDGAHRINGNPYWCDDASPADPLQGYYTISNGIARHESVSEDEVARRVSGIRGFAHKPPSAHKLERLPINPLR